MQHKILFDTNILIGIFHKNFQLEKFKEIKQRPSISAISVTELFALSGMSNDEEQMVKHLIAQTNVVPVTETIAICAGKLARTRPNKKHRTDLLIAATALEMNCPLLTYNTRDFATIPRLKLFEV